MRLDDLLPRLELVRSRSNGRYASRCPAHADKTPSLSISEGDKGLLLRCFAGCSLQTICAALAISQRDLFFDSLTDPQAQRDAVRRRELERVQRARQRQADGLTVDALKSAETFVHSRRGLDISNWPPDRLDEELDTVADAYAVLESEGTYD